jgi:hypothetical protein
MKKTTDMLMMKRFRAIDGPFEKPPKSQPTDSGGQGLS